MTGTGPIHRHLPQAGHPNQPQAELGTHLDLGNRDMQRGSTKDSDPRRDDRFSKAMQKAMAAQKPAPKDEVDGVPVGFALFGATAFIPVDQTVELAPSLRSAVVSIAERIDRYIRGAEGARSLKDGQSMVVRLPANAIGVSSVTVQMRGDVLQVTIGLQAAAAAESGMQSQLAMLGQVLSLRQPKQTIRVALGEGGDLHAEEGPDFNPLMPRGRSG